MFNGILSFITMLIVAGFGGTIIQGLIPDPNWLGIVLSLVYGFGISWYWNRVWPIYGRHHNED